MASNLLCVFFKSYDILFENHIYMKKLSPIKVMISLWTKAMSHGVCDSISLAPDWPPFLKLQSEQLTFDCLQIWRFSLRLRIL